MNGLQTTLVKTAILFCVGVAALIVGHAVQAETGASSAKVAFALKERHSSRISGTATLSDTASGLRVVLRLVGRLQGGGQLAHIHTGPCRREPTFANPRIWLSLNDVVKGKSVTSYWGKTLAQHRARVFSINVHDPDTLGVVACGDIPPAK